MGETYLQEVGDYYSILTEQCAGIINQSEALTCTVPEAAFYLFIDIKNTKLSDHEFCQRLLQEEHTALTPGSSFGRDYGSYVRASVSGHKEEVLEGIARLVRFGSQAKHGSAWLPVHTKELSKVSHAV
jgi:aspartate/methionine/tyrosine aminotransferase